jgi:hypothetical protein
VPEVRTTIESINFKQVPDGYVYRAPSRWLFGPARHYLANEAQKAAIVAVLTPRRPILFQSILWIAFTSMVAAGGGIVWACTGDSDPT